MRCCVLWCVLMAMACGGEVAPASDAGSDGASTSCEPGQTVSCPIACPSGKQGARRCNADGTGYGDCACM